VSSREEEMKVVALLKSLGLFAFPAPELPEASTRQMLL
jgi:hypothetical protein